MPFKPLLRWMSPAGTRARLSVLIFHRVLAKPDPLLPENMHVFRFNAICGWVAKWFNVLPLDVATAQLKTGTLPERAASITFDDGYADNFHVALPILRHHGLAATFFVATGFLDGGRMWNDSIVEAVRDCSAPALDLSSIGRGCHDLTSIDDRRAAISVLINQIKYLPVGQRVEVTEDIGHLAQVQLPENLMMTSAEVNAMHKAGMQIGAHTISHPILARLTEDQANLEIKGSKTILEGLLGERVGLFAYPNGKRGEDYTERDVELVRNLGFDAAVSTEWGASDMDSDPFQIRRFTPWDTSRLRFGGRILSNLRNAK